MADHAATAEKDGDGLVIQRYQSMVLVVVPPSDYGEQTLRHARSSLHNVHVGTRSVSTDARELIKGRLQDEFLVDGDLASASLEGCAGVIFVGGEGAKALFDDAHAQRLAREASDKDLMIGAWGHSVGILARAGILKGRRVTADPEIRADIERAGGKFTGRQIEEDGNLVTAADEAVGIRFGKALAKIVGI